MQWRNWRILGDASNDSSWGQQWWMLFTCRIAQPDSHALSATRHRFLDYQTSAAYAAGSVLPTWATPQPPEHSHITNPNSLTQPDAKTGGESPPTQKAQRKSSDFRWPEGEFAELQSARVGDEGLERWCSKAFIDRSSVRARHFAGGAHAT